MDGAFATHSNVAAWRRQVYTQLRVIGLSLADKYLPEEREAVRDLLLRIYAMSGARSWAAFARLAGVSEFSLTSWRSGREMPGAVNLLRMLCAVGVLGPNLELPHDSPRSRSTILVCGRSMISEVRSAADQ